MTTSPVERCPYCGADRDVRRTLKLLLLISWCAPLGIVVSTIVANVVKRSMEADVAPVSTKVEAE